MKKFIIILMTGILLSLVEQVYAQDWISAMPMNYNPSFAGSSGGLRLNSNTFYQNTNSPYYENHSRFTQQFSGDHFIQKISTGFGINVKGDFMKNPYEWSAYIKNNQYTTEFIVAPKISIKGKYTLSPSISGTFINIDYKVGALNYLVPQIVNKNFWSFRTGLLFNSKKFYAGTTFINGITPYSDKYEFIPTIQLGYTTSGDEAKNSLSVQGNLIMKKRNYLPQLPNGNTGTLNLTGRHKRLLAGTGITVFSHYLESFQLMTGLQLKKFRVMYIQDIITVGAGSFPTYSASLSLRYIFKNKNSATISN